MKFRRIKVDKTTCDGCDIRKYFKDINCGQHEEFKCVGDHAEHYIYKRVKTRTTDKTSNRLMRRKLSMQRRMIRLLELLTDKIDNNDKYDNIICNSCRMKDKTKPQYFCESIKQAECKYNVEIKECRYCEYWSPLNNMAGAEGECRALNFNKYIDIFGERQPMSPYFKNHITGFKFGCNNFERAIC